MSAQRPLISGKGFRMTSLDEAQQRYGDLVASAGGKIFGIGKGNFLGREGEKLQVGSPDGLVKTEVFIGQPSIERVLRERVAGVVARAADYRKDSRETQKASAPPARSSTGLTPS
jgi:hypothetical protein